MTNPYLKKCERCGELYQLRDGYESYKVPSAEKVHAQFVTAEARYKYVDLCDECVDDFDKWFKLFMQKVISISCTSTSNTGEDDRA